MSDITISVDEQPIDWINREDVDDGEGSPLSKEERELNHRDEQESDQQLDDDTVTLRGLSDEALEYVLNTYDVELVE